MSLPKDIPLSALDPRYRELLLRGARERFELACETKGQAVRFAQVLQSYRARMRKHHEANRELWEPLYGCVIRKRESVLVFEPRDSEFDNLLTAIPRETTTLPAETKNDLLSELKAEQDD